MNDADKQRASRLLHEGRLREAYEAFTEILPKYAEDWTVYDGLAYLEVNLRNNFEQAENLIEKAKEYGCPEARYHRVRADIYWRKGQSNEAVSQFEQAATIDRSVENLTAFANSLMKTDYCRAVPVWEEIVQKDPTNTTAYLGLAWIADQREDWAMALKMGAAAKELEPDNPRVLFQLGRAHQGLAQYEKAVDCHLQADELGFRNKFFLHENVAICYLALANYAKALEHAYEAQKVNPEDAGGDGPLRKCKEYLLWLCGEQRDSEAYPMMVIGLQAWPDDSTLLAYMAKLEMVFKHNFELGKEYIHKAFACNNADLDLLHQIKGYLWYDYLNEKEQGLASLEKAVSLRRSNTNLTSLACRILDVDTGRAESLFNEAISSNPEDVDAICGLTEISFREGKCPEGMELAKKGYALDPSNPGVNALLGYGYYQLQEFAESLGFYLKTEELDFPDKAYVYTSIAQCYVRLGKREEARKYAEEALKVDAEAPEAKNILSDLT